MNSVIAIERDGKTIELSYDECGSSPRTEWDNDDKFCLFHRRYTLPNETNYKQGDFDSWEDMEKQIRKDYNVAEILPVYMYDHSGVTISTKSFSCQWDSGQIGFIFITKEDARKTHLVKKLSKQVKEQVHKNLLASVEVYDQYLRGDIYYYTIKDEDGFILDSCGGIYGYEDALKQANDSCDSIKLPQKENEDQLQLTLE